VFHILCASMSTVTTANSALALCATKEERVANENAFVATHCQPVFDNLEEAIKRYVVLSRFCAYTASSYIF
jgi:hypothetical protein